MPTFLNLFRRPPADRDAMRESTALTTVYLLELNQKFEGYMRRKVEELEGRVSAQQARYTSASMAEEEPRPVEAVGGDFETDDSFDFEPPEPLVEPLGMTDDDRGSDASELQMTDLALETSPTKLVNDDDAPDYLSLLGGNSPSNDDEAPLETWPDSPDLPGELVERDLDLSDAPLFSPAADDLANEEGDDDWNTSLSGDEDEAEAWA